MKNKNIVLVLILFLSLFVNVKNVYATIQTNTGLGGTSPSSGCGGDFCVSLAGPIYNSVTKVYDGQWGLRFSIVDSTGSKVSKYGSINLYQAELPGFVYGTSYNSGCSSKSPMSSRVVCYVQTYFKNLNETNTDQILKKMPGYDTSIYSYYLKAEPIFTILSHGSSVDNGTYAKIILQAYTAHEFQTYIESLSGYGYFVNGGDGDEKWNTAKNFLTGFYAPKNTCLFDNKNLCYDGELPTNYENYFKKPGLGVSYLKISDIIPPQDCVSIFNNDPTYRDSMKKRVELYNDYPKNNNLLNLNAKTGEEACKTVTCNVNMASGCFSAEVSNNFKDNDLSCYNETFDIGGKTAYCLNYFELNRSINITNKIPESGTLLFNITNPQAAIGTLTRNCYFPNNEYTSYINRYSEYVKDVSVKLDDGTSIKLKEGPVTDKVTITNGITHIKNVKTYEFPPVYGVGLTGKLSYTPCADCKFLGYGVASRFTDKLFEDDKVKFYNYYTIVNLKDKKLFESDSIAANKLASDKLTGKCYYYANPKLIKDGEPQLHFRIIDTRSPFPGKGGDGRNTSLNWCGLSTDKSMDCSPTNVIVNQFISTKNNSYNVLNLQPKYKITLTPSDILIIRKYNKNNLYDDFNYDCDADRTNCKNKFLQYLQNGSLPGLGTLSNELETN